MHGDLCSNVEFSSMLWASFRMIVLMVSFFTLEQLSIEAWGLIGEKCSGHFSISKHQYPPKTIVVGSVGLMA